MSRTNKQHCFFPTQNNIDSPCSKTGVVTPAAFWWNRFESGTVRNERRAGLSISSIAFNFRDVHDL